MTTNTDTSPTDIRELHEQFLAILPTITRHGIIAFRYIRCQDKRDDCVAEVIALTWKWFLRLVQQGKNPSEFPSTLASFAARAVRSGRRLCGQEASKDAMSRLGQQRHSFVTQSLPSYDTGTEDNTALNALQDNHVTPPPDQAHFRDAFPRWMLIYAERDRSIIHDLMQGERTLDIADKYALSPARISQKRREFMTSWEQFCGDTPSHVEAVRC